MPALSGLRISLSRLPAPFSLALAGTSVTTGAKVGGYYTNPGGLKLDGSGDLHIWNTSNCGTWFSSGDAATLTGDFTVSPNSLTFTASGTTPAPKRTTPRRQTSVRVACLPRAHRGAPVHGR